jgi:hypothetical protein
MTHRFAVRQLDNWIIVQALVVLEKRESCLVMSRNIDSWKRELKVGAVVRRTPGVTRWAKHVWKPVAVIPGASEAFWTEMVRDGEVVDYHAGTVSMELFRADVEGYLVSLNMTVPSIWIILDRDEIGQSPSGWFVSAITASAYDAQDALDKDITSQSPSGWVVSTITASAHEALDSLDSGESIVEAVPVPESLAAWIKEFIDMHFIEEPFKKRRRKELNVHGVEDAKGDARIRQESDVYRAPSNIKKPKVQ